MYEYIKMFINNVVSDQYATSTIIDIILKLKNKIETKIENKKIIYFKNIKEKGFWTPNGYWIAPDKVLKLGLLNKVLTKNIPNYNGRCKTLWQMDKLIFNEIIEYEQWEIKNNNYNINKCMDLKEFIQLINKINRKENKCKNY